MASSHREILDSTLTKLRKRIKRALDRSQALGEQNTKSTLIDPLLQAIGWDVEEFDEVRREYKRKPQDNPVDYALLVLRSPQLFIEAKDLSRDLNDRKWISQTLGYATVVGVKWCVLTNGDEYRIYNSHAAVDVEEKLFRRVRITELDSHEFTLETLALLSKDQLSENQLESLWKAHFVDRQVKAALDNLFRTGDPSLARVIRKQTPGLKPSQIRGSLKRADVVIDFPALQVETTRVPTPSKPKMRSAKKKKSTPTSKAHQVVRLRDIVEARLISLPLALKRRYKKVDLAATISSDGKVLVDEVAYASPSTAAGMARKKVIGAPPGREYPQTNGWTFWTYKDPSSGEEKQLDYLRKLYLSALGTSGA